MELLLFSLSLLNEHWNYLKKCVTNASLLEPDSQKTEQICFVMISLQGFEGLDIKETHAF
jgi:hypothetical protein